MATAGTLCVHTEISNVRATARALVEGASQRVRRIIEGLLHPRRRSSARQRVRSLGRVERVLFVCHGNIYRSPFAEGVFRSLLPAEMRHQVVALSAGFVAPGRTAPDWWITLAQQHGIDLTPHRSQLLSPGLVQEAHLVVVMNPVQGEEICRRFPYASRRVLVLGDLDPEPIRTREIEDPWNRPQWILEETTSRVSRCVRELVAELVGGYAHPGGRGS